MLILDSGFSMILSWKTSMGDFLFCLGRTVALSDFAAVDSLRHVVSGPSCTVRINFFSFIRVNRRAGSQGRYLRIGKDLGTLLTATLLMTEKRKRRS